MEQLTKIEDTIASILVRNNVSLSQIKNIIELVKIYGEIQFSNGVLHKLTELEKQLNNGKK